MPSSKGHHGRSQRIMPLIISLEQNWVTKIGSFASIRCFALTRHLSSMLIEDLASLLL